MKATADNPPRTGRSSAKRRPTRTSAESFALTGPSHPPDPATNAYRKDLADVALAGAVLASHYAEPLDRVVAVSTPLRSSPSDDAEAMIEVPAGEAFAMVDECVGWAWGYAGKARRVGYIRADALKTPS